MEKYFGADDTADNIGEFFYCKTDSHKSFGLLVAIYFFPIILIGAVIQFFYRKVKPDDCYEAGNAVEKYFWW